MRNDELEAELSQIFMALENEESLDKDQITTLKYACGFNPKPVCIEHLDNLFKDIGTIFRSGK